ncbi:MAG: hypothetical protein ACLPT4_07440 [Verrucomicrobiia bacterium]
MIISKAAALQAILALLIGFPLVMSAAGLPSSVGRDSSPAAARMSPGWRHVCTREP